MESNYQTMMRVDKQLLTITHLSQLLSCITGFGGLIVPLVLWLTQKDKVLYMNHQGKQIINFQLSLIIYSIICIPLIIVFGLGILGLILIWFISIIFPIINAIKANSNETTHYPWSINFVS